MIADSRFAVRGSRFGSWKLKHMDLNLKGKVALIAGASKGLGYAVAHALAREGAIVSISSRDEAAITAAAARIERDTGSKVLAMPVDVRSADAIQRWVKATRRAVRRDRCADDQLGRAAGGRGGVVRRPGLAGCRGFAAVQRAPHGPRGRAVDAGARRRRDSRLDVVIGQGADPEPRAVDGAARVGVGARQDAGDRARGVENPRQSDHSRAASTPTAFAISTRSTRRSRASRSRRRRRERSPRFRWAGTAKGTSSDASARSCCPTRPSYMTGATVQVDGGRFGASCEATTGARVPCP